MRSANDCTSSNDVKRIPAATQSSPIDGATTPEVESVVRTFATCAPMSPSGFEDGGFPVPIAHCTSGNVGMPESGGTSSFRLYPKPAAKPVMKKNAGPPIGSSSTAYANSDDCPSTWAYPPSAAMEISAAPITSSP